MSLQAPADAVVVVHYVRAVDATKSQTTPGTGHYQFLPDGVRLKTDDATSKVEEYFPLTIALASVTNTSYTWLGAAGVFSQLYAIDTDGNGTWDGKLESRTDQGPASPRVAATEDSPDAFRNVVRAGDKLTDWSAAFPGAVIRAGGFRLSPGAASTGVLGGLTYGPHRYKFTTQVLTHVTGTSVVKVTGRFARIDMVSNPQPPNTILGNRIKWRIYADGKSAFSIDQGFGRKDFWAQTFAKGTGRHTVVLYKNGVKSRTFFVYTGA